MSNDVNNVTARRWEDAFNTLLDHSPQVVNNLIHSIPDVQFFKVWHRYGKEAQGPERKWAEKYGAHPGLTPQGILAMEFLRRGLSGSTWDEDLATVLISIATRKQPNGRWLKLASPAPFSPNKTPPEAT